MAKEMSELLADLSSQAKQVEDGFAAIADETDAKAAERRDKTRAAAASAVDTLDRGVSSVEDSMAVHWQALQDRMKSEITGIKADIADRQHERDLNWAEQQADAAQDRAVRTVAFAAAAIQAAGAAVLDSAVARREAEGLRVG